MILDDNFFKMQIQHEKTDFKNRVREILYWQDVTKIFRESKEAGKNKITISFPHEGTKDNSEKIMYIADQFGYTDKSCNIKPTETVYTFELIS